MINLSLGNTLEEKRQTYEALTAKSKKWGKVFRVIGAIFGAGLGILLLGAFENTFLGVFTALILAVVFSFSYYWYGQIVFYGYLIMMSFFSENNVSGGAVAGAVGTSFLVSYALGGRKAVKKLGIAWIVILLFALTIGIIVGFYYYLKFRKEAKELELNSKEQSPNIISYDTEIKEENIMFCSNCGKKLEDGAGFCSSCGAKVNGEQTNPNSQNSSAEFNGPSHHTVPKCTYCGNIEEWKVGPLFRPLDYILGVTFLIFGVIPGLIYMGVVGLIRSNKNNREKICKKCGAKNMFTNMY